MLCGILDVLGGTAFSTPQDEAYQRGLAAYTWQDYATAVRIWQPLAQQGMAAAQHNLGVMYSQGQGVARNDAEAVKWYCKAADQGYALGQRNLGSLNL